MSVDAAPEPLCDPVLIDRGIPHGFGQRGSRVPGATFFPTQVHGTAVLRASLADGGAPGAAPEADAVWTTDAGCSVGIVTADCVPILAAASDARIVTAIHAGWRGLAAGVIEAGLDVLRDGAHGAPLVAAIGPAARACCYEVDEPVRAALMARHGSLPDEVLRPGRPDRYQLDLPRLALRVLAGSGVDPTRIGTHALHCTICDPRRFESHRRDGASAGRLRHFITRPEAIPRQG